MIIPDPIERMEARMDDLAVEWNILQRDVPLGSFRCPYCKQLHNYEPIQMTPSPDSPVCCYDCLPPETQKAYDAWEDSWKPITEIQKGLIM